MRISINYENVREDLQALPSTPLFATVLQYENVLKIPISSIL